MVGSGDTVPAGVPLADSRCDRTPFCTLQASKDCLDKYFSVSGPASAS
jgi:hypothetical protein